MYFKFFGLQTKPFQITPDPDFLYLSPSHKQALGSLIYGIKEKKGFIAVTGQVGLGKTTILRSFLNQNHQANQESVYLLNPNLSFTGLLKILVRELGHNPIEGDDADVLEQLHFVLIEKYREGRTVVLLIDEAQNMPVDTLEQLRMLSNLETPKDKLIQIVLLGQPELDGLLDRDELRQLRQRIAVRAIIQPLSKQESFQYIRHRLDKAGGEGKKFFTNSALAFIVQEAKGIPRRLNILCDNALVTAFGYNKALVTAQIAKEVIGDLAGRSSHSLWKLVPLIGLALILVLALVALLPLTHSQFSDISPIPEIGQLFKDEDNPNQDLVIVEEKIPPHVQHDLTLIERAQTFLTESVSEVFEKLRNRVVSHSESTTTQPHGRTNIDPDNQENLRLAGIPPANFQKEVPIVSEALEVPAAPETVSPGILPPHQQELFDLSTQEEGIGTAEANSMVEGATLIQDKAKTPSENPGEANLVQLNPENISERAGQPTVFAEETINPIRQESPSSIPAPQTLMTSQEMTGKQPEAGASPSSVMRIVKKGDTMAKLLHDVYGSAILSTVQFVLEQNPHIESVRKMYPGQKIMFPPLESVEDKKMVAEADEPLVSVEDKELPSSKKIFARSTAQTKPNEIKIEDKRDPPYAVATVQEGDTLEKLVKAVYGSPHPSYMQRVLEYNPIILNSEENFPRPGHSLSKIAEEVKTTDKPIISGQFI